jgi:beta-lactamase regulating signal transducer with metallopeptidase domain
MTAVDVLQGLLRTNLAAGVAILGVISLRKMFRPRFGAQVAYGLWLAPVLAAAAVLAPARQVMVVASAAQAMAGVAHARLAALAPSSAPAASLDAPALLVGMWLVGVAAAALVMARLQHRFLVQARRGAVGPSVVGVIAPRIVMPDDFAERYSREERALVLAHERTHIARQDSRLNGLCAAIQCLCWFNPLVHLGARLMRIDQELACDEAVVTRFPGSRRAYAEVLVKAQLAVLPLPLGCHWPSKAEHPLLERLGMLKQGDVGRARRLAGAAVLTALCASGGLAAWAAQPADVRIAIRPAVEGPLARPAQAGVVAPGLEGIAARDEVAALAPGGRHAAGKPARPIGDGLAAGGQSALSPTPDHAVTETAAVRFTAVQETTLLPTTLTELAPRNARPLQLAQLQAPQSDEKSPAPDVDPGQTPTADQRRRGCWTAPDVQFPKRACMTQKQWAQYLHEQQGSSGGSTFPVEDHYDFPTPMPPPTITFAPIVPSVPSVPR